MREMPRLLLAVGRFTEIPLVDIGQESDQVYLPLVQNVKCNSAISASSSCIGPITLIAFGPHLNTSRQGKSIVGFSPWLPVSIRSRDSVMP